MKMNNEYTRNWANPVQVSIVGAYTYKVPTMTLPGGRVINFVHTEMDSFHFRKDYKSWATAQRWAKYWAQKLKDNGAYWGTMSIFSDARETWFDL